MICFHCGAEIAEEMYCPHCHMDQKLYRKIIFASQVLYNRGLEKAKVRDLSGAMQDLKQSLNYNKYHVDARNLLGLVYFEIGEYVYAMREWVISKHLVPENPVADRYLDEIQNTPGMLDKMSQTTKKYNQALVYCQQDSRDLAIIQLKKVLGVNPKLVAGHQLLALLYIQDKKYEEAKKTLAQANRIDVKNTITLRYSKEVKEAIRQQNQTKKKKKRNDIVAFQDGHDTIMMPETSWRDMFDSSKASLVNIAIGLLIGLLICFFLIIPTVRQNARNEAANHLIEANTELTTSAGSVKSLQKQVEDLQKQLEKYTNKGDAVTSYEQLAVAKEAYDRGDLQAAGEAIDVVNGDILGEKAKATYMEVFFAVYNQRMQQLYQEAITAKNEQELDVAIEKLEEITKNQEDYENGDALFALAQCYQEKQEGEKALAAYQKVAELFPDRSIGRQSQDIVDFFANIEQ